MVTRSSEDRASSRPFQDIAALASDAIYVHRDGTLLWANEAAERMFAATSERPLVGASAWDLVAPQHVDDVKATYRAMGPTDAPTEVAVMRRRLDGALFPTRAYGASIEWDDGPATLMLIRDLSETVALQATLAEVSAREIDVAEVSPDAMLIHLNGRIVFVNKAACEMFRAQSPADLIGRNVLDLVHPESREYIKGNWKAATGGVGDELVEMRRLRLDGTDFIGEARHRIVSWHGQQGFLVVIRDATPRIANQKALAENESQMRSLLDALPDTVIAHISRKIVFVNRTACRMFGANAPEDLIGLDMLDLVHPDDAPLLVRNWEKIEASVGQKNLTLRRRRLDGSYFLGEAYVIKEDWKGEHGHLVVIRDVTEAVAAERKLQEAREEAERANETKSRYFAGMSHELRTPLNAILGFSEAIKQQVLGPVGNEKYLSYADDIHRSGGHLLSLIDDLLDLSKAESGRYELHEVGFDLVAATDKTIRMMQPLAERKSIRLTLEKAPDALCVHASEREIRQIVTNLLSNAVKFTPDGGRVEVLVAADTHTGIRVSVADTGIGIAAADIPGLFEPYSQALSTRGADEDKGTGLGLALSRRFAELHGGTIELESVVGRGTTVTLVLPKSRLSKNAAACAA